MTWVAPKPRRRSRANRPACHYCLRKLYPLRMLQTGQVEASGQQFPTADHVLPICVGGTDETGMIASCQRCNTLRGHVPYRLFYAFSVQVIRHHPNAEQDALRRALYAYIQAAFAQLEPHQTDHAAWRAELELRPEHPSKLSEQVILE